MSETPNFSFEPAPKRGPGRPKGSTNKPRETPTQTSINADVKQAIATLDTVYNLVATGLLMGGLNATLGAWTEATDNLRKSNEDALRSAPKLAHWIANAGTAGGAATFLISHGIAIGSVLGIARMELAVRRATNADEKAKEAAPSQREYDPTFIPGL